MAIRYANATVGTRPSGAERYPVTGTATGAAAQAGHVSIAWDDAAITNLNQLRHAVDALLRQIEGTGIAKG